LIPIVEGRVHHFRYAGLYNGLALVRDQETSSFWSHYTGECVHGRHRGARLEPFSPIRQMTAEQALERYPEAELGLASPGLFARVFSRLMQVSALKPKGSIPPHFYRTIDEPDRRRPRLDMGLGVTCGDAARYYPLETLGRDTIVNDTLAGRGLVVYLDPVTRVPDASFSEAGGTRWEGDRLRLESGRAISNGRLEEAGGATERLERPVQQFTRWYGFSYTYPGCDIYAEC